MIKACFLYKNNDSETCWSYDTGSFFFLQAVIFFLVTFRREIILLGHCVFPVHSFSGVLTFL